MRSIIFCAFSLSLISSSEAQEVKVPLLSNKGTLESQELRPADSVVAVEIDGSEKTVKVRLPFSFDRLSDMTASELGEALGETRKLRIDGVPVTGAIPLDKENLILATADGETVRIIQRFGNGRVLVVVLDKEGRPVTGKRLWFLTSKGEVIAPAVEEVYTPDGTVLQPTIGERYEIVIDRSQPMYPHIGEAREAAIALIDTLGPSARCRFSVFARQSIYYTPVSGVSAYAPCTVENFERSVRDFELYETEQNAEAAYVSVFDFMHRRFPTYELKSHTVVQAAFFITDGGGVSAAATDRILAAKGDFPSAVYLLGKEDRRGIEGWADSIVTKSSGTSPVQAMRDWASLYVHAVMIDPSDCCAD